MKLAKDIAEGIFTGLTKNIAQIIDDSKLSPEEKTQARIAVANTLAAHEAKLEQISSESFEAEILDKLNARERELKYSLHNNKPDYLMWIVGIVLLGCFSSTYIVPIFYPDLSDKPFFIENASSIRAIIFAMAGYYWGTSKSSARKDTLLAGVNADLTEDMKTKREKRKGL